MGIVISLISLSLLVFFHELGHYSVARYFGVKILTFSIGFGKAIYKKVVNGTEYVLAVIPLGGYVRMKGQDDIDIKNINKDADSYQVLHPLKKICILLAGPFANFLVAFVLFFTLSIQGHYAFSTNISKVMDNTPAQKAGLLPKDKIIKVDGKETLYWNDIVDAIKESKKDVIKFEVKRGSLYKTITIKPDEKDTTNVFKEHSKRKMIGIMADSKNVLFVKSNIFSAIKDAFGATKEASLFIVKALEKTIEGVIPAENIGGVISIVEATKEATNHGINSLIYLVALISVNLGIVNLLPIPALDGGHILVNIYTLIRRKEPTIKAMYYITLFGWAILILLLIFGTYNDITRLVEHKF